MRRKLALFFIGCCSCVASAQLGGESTYQFLNLVSSPRQAALGGKILTNVDYDVTQALYNPATINAKMNNQLALSYTSHLGAVGYGTAAYAYTNKDTKTFHGGITYVNYGEFDGYDEDGNETGTFTGSEAALSLGYAMRVGSKFYAGANVKFITSTLEQYSSLGAALDFGFIYINEESNFNATLVVRNFGTQITTYAGLNEPLPFEIDLGFSKRLENVPIRWHVTLENLQEWPIAVANPARVESDLSGNETEEDVTLVQNIMRHTILGVELFPESGFNIRLGYSFRRGEELRIVDERNFSGVSAGIGIKMKKMRFSYTYAKYSSAASSSFFGINIDLQ